MRANIHQGQQLASRNCHVIVKGKPLPFCPQEWLNNADNRMKLADIQAWALRGAINAGFSVFVYLQDLAKISKEGGHPQPAFDCCEQLKN